MTTTATASVTVTVGAAQFCQAVADLAPFACTDDTLPTRYARENGYPEPAVKDPTAGQVTAMLRAAATDSEVSFETTDGCEVEPDGTCPHSHPTWLRRFGLI